MYDKKYVSEWSLFERILLFICIVVLLWSGFICKSDLITILESLTGIYCAISQTRRKVVAQFVGVIDSILYCIIAFQSRYYGEVFTHLFVTLPLYIVGIYTWITYKDSVSRRVKRYNITLKDWIFFGLFSVIMFVFIYFVLKYFHTEQLFISTFSVLFNVGAIYLVVRRSKYGFICYLLYDIILIMLWGVPFINGDYSLIPMLMVSFLYYMKIHVEIKYF